MASVIRIMTCGSVDDGKSTLLGRILYETDNIFEDQSSELVNLDTKYGKAGEKVDYSLLLDGLLDEKKQGITIDLAYKYFSYKNKKFIFIDSPGHKEFTRNVANAASFANVALVLIDINNGVTSQTKKHLEIISLFSNIEKIIVCINKIDSVKNKVSLYRNVKKLLIEYSNKINVKIDSIIPVSAISGENIIFESKNKNFYSGKTLLEIFKEMKINTKTNQKNSAIKIDFVSKKSNKERLAFGKNFLGSLEIGQELINLNTGESTQIKKIYYNLSTESSISPNINFSFSYSPQISLEKGDVLVESNLSDNFSYTNSINAKVIWTSKNQPLKSKRYILKFGNKNLFGFFSSKNVEENKVNSIFDSTIELEKKHSISTYSKIYEFSRFLIIDPQSFESLGFGYVNYSLDRGSNVIEQTFPSVSSTNPPCLWFTGLPASGKSTIASALGKELKSRNINFYILDGDNLRSTINKDLGFTESDRMENLRRVAHIAKILQESGVLPIVSTISPIKSSRDFARSLFEKDKFFEIFIKTSLKECIKRDPKGLYKNKKNIKNITGLHNSYEIPENPDLIIDTEDESVAKAVEKLIYSFI